MVLITFFFHVQYVNITLKKEKGTTKKTLFIFFKDLTKLLTNFLGISYTIYHNMIYVYKKYDIRISNMKMTNFLIS